MLGCGCWVAGLGIGCCGRGGRGARGCRGAHSARRSRAQAAPSTHARLTPAPERVHNNPGIPNRSGWLLLIISTSRLCCEADSTICCSADRPRLRLASASQPPVLNDGGHGNLPVGGHRNSPVTATGSPHGWPSDLPTTTVLS